MQACFSRATAIFALVMASMLMTIGCGTTDGGDSGDRGTAGNGGTPIPGLEGVTQCVSSAYQVVFRGLVEPLDPLLRYIDTPTRPPPDPPRDPLTVPQISMLTEDTEAPGVYSQFTWNADDVDGVSDPDGMLITVGFKDSGGLNPVNLDDGIGNMQVAHIPWEITVGTLPTVVGKGKMFVAGLGEDTIRMGIIPRDDADPPDAPLPRDEGNPWYGGVQNYCRFEVPSFMLHLDLATPGSEPTNVVVGFIAESRDYDIENGWFYFEEDDTVRFEGDLKIGGADPPVRFNLTLDYRTDPATVGGTFGGSTLPPDCIIDLDTFDLSC